MSRRHPTPFLCPPQRTTSIDPAVLGDWVSGQDELRIDADGWAHLSRPPVGYVLSADGQTLTIGSGDPSSRLYGDPGGLEGAWTTTWTDGGDTQTETLTLLPDRTYTSHWTWNGAFDSHHLGVWSATASHIDFIDRRAVVRTGHGNQMVWDMPFNGTIQGTYQVTGADTWIMMLGGGTTTWTRA